MSARVVICTPVRGSNLAAANVSLGWAESVRRVCVEYGADVISGSVTFGSEPVRANNRLVSIFLTSFPNATHLLHWDDENWPDETELLGRMLATGEHVIGAPYTTKRKPLRFVHRGPVTPIEGREDIAEVVGLGMGFTLTSRACLEKLYESGRKYTDFAGDKRYECSDIYGHVYEHWTLPSGEEVDTLLSDDLSFCHRWRELGGRCCLYTQAGVIRHAGGHDWSVLDQPEGVRG